MTRKMLEESAKSLYNPNEIKLLLKGFDLGMAHAKEMMQSILNDNEFRK